MMRKGQAVVYLAVAMLAIAILCFMNVNFFLAVRAKNRMMNAVDAGAVAAARHQGAILNEIGRLNREHLILAMSYDVDPVVQERLNEIEEQVKQLVTKAPMGAIGEAQTAAASWGCRDVEVEPGFVERDDLWKMDPLTNRAFYDAIKARTSCWFTIGSRRRFLNMSPSEMLANRDKAEPDNVGNCEYFSVHVKLMTWDESAWAGFGSNWTNFIMQVTGKSAVDIRKAKYLRDGVQRWAFYDASWERKWSDTFAKDKGFPINGSVKPEYDLVGCSAQCRLRGSIWDFLQEKNSRILEVTAEAKPFGTVIDLNGMDNLVTAFNCFIIPSNPNEDRIFTDAQLVIFGSVPHENALSTQREWYEHVTVHLENGRLENGCDYCQQLRYWEVAANREEAKTWLRTHECYIGNGDDGGKGGYDCAH